MGSVQNHKIWCMNNGIHTVCLVKLRLWKRRSLSCYFRKNVSRNKLLYDCNTKLTKMGENVSFLCENGRKNKDCLYVLQKMRKVYVKLLGKIL